MRWKKFLGFFNKNWASTMAIFFSGGGGAGDSHITRTGVLIVSLKVEKVGLIPFRVLTLKSTQQEL